MLIEGVKESAELIETDEQDDILPPDEHYSEVVNYSEGVNAISAEERIALAMEIDRRMHAADARIKPDSSVVSAAEETVTLKNSLGMNLSHRSNMIYAYASCLAREGESAATGFKLLWGYDKEAVAPHLVADGCIADALSKLGAGRMASGTRPVVIRNTAMADLLSGADVTEGYRVTLRTNTGATTQTDVYCIGGKWVTKAFFDMQFT